MLKREEGLQFAAFTSRVLQIIIGTEHKHFQSWDLPQVPSPVSDMGEMGRSSTSEILRVSPQS